MTPQQSAPMTVDEILADFDKNIRIFHDGGWNYSGETPLELAKAQINRLLVEARLDEQKRRVAHYGETCGKDQLERIAELESQLTQEGKEDGSDN